MLTNILLGLILVLLAVLIYLIIRKDRPNSHQLEAVLANAWIELGIDEKVGRLGVYAEDIRRDYRALEQMLRVPTARGGLGEIGLETILADQLPPEVYGIRKRILNGRTPDAYIESTVGIICIDSKFPLDNYRKLLETERAEKEGHKRQFLRDVQGHLKKIAQDYICPGDGSANFAFAYIPAEGVYWFLASEAYDLLHSYTRQGVQVVSPLTLSHKIELIKTGIYAKKLTDEADTIRAEISRLAKGFQQVDAEWRVFYQMHLTNLTNKATDVDKVYRKLREEFEQIAKLSEK